MLPVKNRFKTICLTVFLVVSFASAEAQGTVPTFKRSFGTNTYTFAGRDPAQKGTTVIPTILVPVTLTFPGKAARLSAEPDVPRILKSPVFSRVGFPGGEKTQYADALLHATFPADKNGHTRLGKPEISPVTIEVSAGSGYLLTAKSSGRSFAVVDSEFVEKEIFRQIPRQDGKLVIAVTHNATYYAAQDATVCCSWGTHGVDAATGNSFVLGSYIGDAPAIVMDRDVQPLTQQLGEFVNDPLHNPQSYFRTATAPGNYFAAWISGQDESGCGGGGVGSNYFLLEPTNTNAKNGFPASEPFTAHAGKFTYHLQNVALLPWYLGTGAPAGSVYSFPNPQALTAPAIPCPDRSARMNGAEPTVTPAPSSGSLSEQENGGQGNGHRLIGYWTGSRFSATAQPFALHEVAPQWDVILVAFAAPNKSGPEGSLYFRLPRGITAEQLKADIAQLKSQGKKVMISLGGGGEYFKLDTAQDIPNFVNTVTDIVTDYGFDGVDIDFETPSLALAPGDTDFRHPTTPSVVNLISGLRQLREHFGPNFMISLVPEGTQIPAGYASYGGQFGSYLPLMYGLRDILSFVDVQDYNTPPLGGLDGEIYQSSSVDYHPAMTELLLHGFNVGGDPAQFFPPMPADKVAVGFLTGYTTPEIVSQAMDWIIAGKAPAGTTYKLLQSSGYPAVIGAMFWTIDADRHDNYKYSNLIGPQLHSYPAK